MTKEKLQDIGFILLLALMVFLMLLSFSSCNPSKKISKSDTTETKTIYKTDTLYRIKKDTIKVTKTETKTETVTEVKFDTIQKDCPKNKITYKASGDIEIEGNIKEFNNVKNQLQKELDSIKNEYELEHSNKVYWEEEAKKTKSAAVVKRGIPAIFWVGATLFSFILFLLGIYVGVRFRHLFTKK